MHRKGHIGVSLIFAGFVFAVVPMEYALPIITILFFTEQLPDLDFKIPVLEHRGFSHTIWAAVIVASAFAGGVVGSMLYTGVEIDSEVVPVFSDPLTTFAVIWIGTVIGFSSHLAGDMITVGEGYYGIQPFAPVSQWESSIQLWPAASPFGNAILLVIGSITALTSGLLTTGLWVDVVAIVV